MNKKSPRRFQTLFRQDPYLALKNRLYNYRLRRRAIHKRLISGRVHRLLEVGSGISPIVSNCPEAVFSDISWTALKQLRRQLGHGLFVVADASRLPFRSSVFSHAISSEVLEHVLHDKEAMGELSRVIEPEGRLLVTVPHRQAYYFNDDRFVSHFRRYEIIQMTRMLGESGLQVEAVEKVLGVLEKVIMSAAVWVYSKLDRASSLSPGAGKGIKFGAAMMFEWINTVAMGIVWAEAKVIPVQMASVVMIDCFRKKTLSKDVVP